MRRVSGAVPGADDSQTGRSRPAAAPSWMPLTQLSPYSAINWSGAGRVAGLHQARQQGGLHHLKALDNPSLLHQQRHTEGRGAERWLNLPSELQQRDRQCSETRRDPHKLLERATELTDRQAEPDVAAPGQGPGVTGHEIPLKGGQAIEDGIDDGIHTPAH